MLLVGGYAWDPRLLLPRAKNPASLSWYNSFPWYYSSLFLPKFWVFLWLFLVLHTHSRMAKLKQVCAGVCVCVCVCVCVRVRARVCVCVFPDDSVSKEPAFQYRRTRRLRFNSWVEKIPWRRKWPSTPVFLPGESHGQRSPLVANSQKRLNTTTRCHIIDLFVALAAE